MPRKSCALVCAVVMLVAVCGCSDDGTMTANTIDPAEATIATQAAVENIVLPTMALFDVLLELWPLPLPGGGGAGGTCDSGGGYSVDQVSITFDQCDQGGTVIDGTITATDPLSGSLALILQVDDDDVAGNGTLTIGACDQIEPGEPMLTIDSFAWIGSAVSTDVRGCLEQSMGVFPGGELRLDAVSSAFDLRIELFFNGSALFTGTVTDHETGEIAAECTGDLVEPRADCVEPGGS